LSNLFSGKYKLTGVKKYLLVAQWCVWRWTRL